jgi:hypothetical protein
VRLGAPERRFAATLTVQQRVVGLRPCERLGEVERLARSTDHHACAQQRCPNHAQASNHGHKSHCNSHGHPSTRACTPSSAARTTAAAAAAAAAGVAAAAATAAGWCGSTSARAGSTQQEGAAHAYASACRPQALVDVPRSPAGDAQAAAAAAARRARASGGLWRPGALPATTHTCMHA